MKESYIDQKIRWGVAVKCKVCSAPVYSAKEVCGPCMERTCKDCGKKFRHEANRVCKECMRKRARA